MRRQSTDGPLRDLLRERESLDERFRSLSPEADPEGFRAMLAAYRHLLEEIAWALPGGEGAHTLRGSRHPGRPVRDLLLEAIADLGQPALTRDLSGYVLAAWQREIPATRYGSIGREEERAWDASEGLGRPAWLAYGLDADTLTPVKRVLGRSDQPAGWRLQTPLSGQVLGYRFLARVCELAGESWPDGPRPAALRDLAADRARRLPGIAVCPGEYPLTAWREQALALVEGPAARDAEAREAVSPRLADLSPREILFGTARVR